MNTKADARIDGYLARVRVALRGMPAAEIDDVLRELHSHIVDLEGADGAGVDAALASLGDPVDLAKTYRTDNLLTHAECAGSPLVILQGLRHASPSRWGRVVVTALYFLGYAYVVALWAAAIEKLFSPSTTGVWYTAGARWPFTLVRDGAPPAHSNELLGWWLIPAFVLLGWILRYAIDRGAQSWIRRYRRSRTGLST